MINETEVGIVRTKIRDIFIDICNNPLDLEDDTDFFILEMDEIDEVEILIGLEMEFDIDIDEDYEDELFFEKYNTINKLCKYIVERINK